MSAEHQPGASNPNTPPAPSPEDDIPADATQTIDTIQNAVDDPYVEAAKLSAYERVKFGVAQRVVEHRIEQVEAHDKNKNAVDKRVGSIVKRGLMLETRRAVKDRRIKKLQTELGTVDPNSRRGRTIRRKLSTARINHRVLNEYVTVLDDSGAAERARTQPDRLEGLKKKRELNQAMLKVAKQVAAEKQRRLAVDTLFMQTQDEAERARLDTERKSWQNIKYFENDLIQREYKKIFPATAGHH